MGRSDTVTTEPQDPETPDPDENSEDAQPFAGDDDILSGHLDEGQASE